VDEARVAQQLADNYIKQELSVLGVNMGNRQDSLQTVSSCTMKVKTAAPSGSLKAW